MQVEYTPKFNFHNRSSVILRSASTKIEHSITRVYITKRQANRLEKHFCGVAGCRCNSAGIVQENEAGTEFSIAIHNA